MGKVVVTEFVSLDGVIEDPGGSEGFRHGGWSFRFDRGPAGDQFKNEELLAADAQLLGRVTYQGFARAWPTIEGTGAYGEKMNSMKKYVVSTTLSDADAGWTNSTVVRGDLARVIPELTAAHEGNLLVQGSCRLVHSLTELGLVDEFRLMVFPVVLGTGKRIFADLAEATTLQLAESSVTGDGVLLLTYRRA